MDKNLEKGSKEKGICYQRKMIWVFNIVKIGPACIGLGVRGLGMNFENEGVFAKWVSDKEVVFAVMSEVVSG